MNRPTIAQRMPCVLHLPPGDYHWCACGRSRSQPFCDGSHAGSGFSPVKFTVSADSGRLWLCACKHTRQPPFCDGTHNALSLTPGFWSP